MKKIDGAERNQDLCSMKTCVVGRWAESNWLIAVLAAVKLIRHYLFEVHTSETEKKTT